MCKQEMKTISVAFVLIFIFIIFMNISYANGNCEDKIRVTITNDNKEISDTHEIIFKTEKNPNVVTNKLAPGTKAIAEIEILIEKTQKPIDLYFNIDDNELNEEFRIRGMIGEKEYLSNESIRLKQDEKIKLTLELEWLGNGRGENIGNLIEIPLAIRAESETN